ncbi:MAG TPA: metalloregulator ArsR/SmtB family transcription factor [Polyangia bacterium]|nr:metalloregulator ArsR/SmtB family transcription factor [Polyangia bacterium]
MNRTRLEKIGKALGDRTRLRIFEAIVGKQAHMTCGEIVALRGISAATVSHHLKILSDAQLIACSRDGKFVYSRAVPETLEDYTRAILALARARKPAVSGGGRGRGRG